MKDSSCNQELYLLLFKLVILNDNFATWLITHGDLVQLLRPLLFNLWAFKADPAKIGLSYNCVFLLLRLASEREFAIILNQPYNNDLPIRIPVYVCNI